MNALNSVFGPTGHVSLAQECARSALIFFYGLILLRVAGRRTFAQWSALDIVVGIVVGSSLSRTLTGNAPLLGTLAATALMTGLHWLFARASAKSNKLSHLIEGSAIWLVTDGKVDRRAVVAQNVSDADLEEAMRQSGTEDVTQTRAIVLEPSGKIAVVR